MKKFGVSTLTKAPGRDIWYNKPSTFDEALLILTQNGWAEDVAIRELDELHAANGNYFIIVNEYCQIC